MMMANSYDDCYFYFYSNCTKGSSCPFRHCELALGTETVCTLWQQGMCFRQNCKFRHMESRINRSAIPCYWESQPVGCCKPHCVFFHKKPRGKVNTVDPSKFLVTPTTVQPIPPVSTQPVVENPEEIADTTNIPTSQVDVENMTLNPIPVKPVVVSLNDGEESDTELLADILSKSPQNLESHDAHEIFSETLDQGDDRDLGIKTLEQIRMEKIHRESEHFYKPAVSDAVAIEPNNTVSEEQQVDPTSDFYDSVYESHADQSTADVNQESLLPNDEFNNDEIFPENDVDVPSELLSNDLRDIIRRKREAQQMTTSKDNESKDKSKKRLISLKRSAYNSDDDLSSHTMVIKRRNDNDETAGRTIIIKKEKTQDILDFRIKTLDEIRKEKRKDIKHDTESITTNGSELRSSWELRSSSSRNTDSYKHTSKRKRPSREIYQAKRSPLKNGVSSRNESHEEDTVPKRKVALENWIIPLKAHSEPEVPCFIGKSNERKGRSMKGKAVNKFSEELFDYDWEKPSNLEVTNFLKDIDENVLLSNRRIRLKKLPKSPNVKQEEKLNESITPEVANISSLLESSNIQVPSSDELHVATEPIATEDMGIGCDDSKNENKQEMQNSGDGNICTSTFNKHFLLPGTDSMASDASKADYSNEDLSYTRSDTKSEICHTENDTERQTSIDKLDGYTAESSKSELCHTEESTDERALIDDLDSYTSTNSKSEVCATEKNTERQTSIDELDKLLLSEDPDMKFDDIDTNSDDKAEDIFLEIEKMLKS